MAPTNPRSLNDLLVRVRACRICVEEPTQPEPLPHEPRPIVQLSTRSRVVIIGQAPGRRVHESGVAWQDPSGDRLRRWLGLDSEQFYDPEILGILPMGFCYPGKAKSGDLPPRRECEPAWHEELVAHLPENRLDVVIGQYAQRHYLPDSRGGVTDVVSRWESYLPHQIVLPHPSPRNVAWFKRNPWFERDVIPAVQARVAEFLSS